MRDTLIIAVMALGVLVMAKAMPASAHAEPFHAPAVIEQTFNQTDPTRP